jgi:hypothetical protein
MQTELNKFFSLGSAWSSTDEQVVQFYLHARSVIQYVTGHIRLSPSVT